MILTPDTVYFPGKRDFPMFEVSICFGEILRISESKLVSEIASDIARFLYTYICLYRIERIMLFYLCYFACHFTYHSKRKRDIADVCSRA